MIIVVLLIGFTVALCFFPVLRCAVFHPVLLVRNGVVDLITYIRHRDFDLLHTGQLVAYVGLFGKGKTLSVVHRVVWEYNRYNGRKVWCMRRMKFVTQRVLVLSNVELKIPFVPMVSLDQIVEYSRTCQAQDDEQGTLTSLLVLGDEFSVQMNSRNFKTNIDPLFLNTLLTCRHFHISIYYTAQRFSHVDALLRQVTSYVVDCNKLWRFQRLNAYDAWDMENATNVMLLQPISRSCWFVTNADYSAYDTLACVGNLSKSVADGDMMSSDEILTSRAGQGGGMDNVASPAKSYIRRKRQEHKK